MAFKKVCPDAGTSGQKVTASTINITRPDVFLNTFFSGCKGLVEVRIIGNGNPKSYFLKSVNEIPWRKLRELNEQGSSIYFGACTRKCEKGDKQSVFEIPGIWIDVDSKNHGGKEGASANIERVRCNTGIEPSVIVDSGNGFHVYLLFREAEVLNSTDDIPRLEGYIKGVSLLFGGDHTHNLDRVMRMPGFNNLKDPSNPKPCQIVSCNPEQRYHLADFEAYRVEIYQSHSEIHFRIQDIPLQIPQRFLELIQKDEKLREAWEGRKDNSNDNSGSGKDMALAHALIKDEFTDAEIARILMEAPYPKSNARTEAYLKLTIAKARSLRGEKMKEKDLSDLPSKIEKMIEEASDPTEIELILLEIEKLPLETIKEYYKEKLSKKFKVEKKALDKDLRKLRKTLDEDRRQKKELMLRDELTTLHPSLDVVPEIAVLGFRVPIIKLDKEGKRIIAAEQRVLISDGTENLTVTGDNHFEVGDIDKKTYWLKSVDSPLPLLSDVWSVDEAFGKPIPPNGIFEEIRELAKKYLDLVEESMYDLLASWIIATYFNRVFNAFPFLFFFGPKDSGKSTALELVVFTAFTGVKVKTISVASLGDIADGLRGTIGIDQAEALYDHHNLELVGILADSYRKEGGKRRVVLISKGIRRVLEFDTYCPKVFASQRDLHRDLKDRCIKIPMLRSDKKLPELEPWSEPWKKVRGKQYQLFLLKWKEVFNLSQKEFSYTGRLKELWKPVKIIMELLAVPQERQDSVQTLFVKLAEGVQEKLSLWEELSFEILLNKGLGKKEDKFTVTALELLSELRYLLDDEPQQLTEQWVGYFISRFQLSVLAPKRRKLAGKLRTEYTVSKERINHVFSRYTEKPDTPETGDNKDNDSDGLDGIRFKNGTSDIPSYPDTEGENEGGITVSDSISIDKNKPDNEKRESLQENMDSGIRVSQDSEDLTKEKISSQSEAKPREKNEEGVEGDTSQLQNTDATGDNKSSITETSVCDEGLSSWEEEVDAFLGKTGGS